jgi:hypothetical protein
MLIRDCPPPRSAAGLVLLAQAYPVQASKGITPSEGLAPTQELLLARRVC